MAAKVNLLKILTVISFLIVIVNGEKISFFIGLYLFLAIFNPYEFGDTVYAYIVSGLSLYLFISGNIRIKKLFDDIICIVSIIAMCILVYRMTDLRYIHTTGIITTSLFGLFSSTTFCMILYKHFIVSF